MKRPIKFRALGIDGDFHFGDLQQLTRTVSIREQGKGTFYVDPDTVAQLVGYDKDGKEVYEGDELTDNRVEFTGDKVTAVLQPFLRHTKAGGFSSISMAEYFDLFWGKELIEDWQVKLKEAEK